jgi:hypothetical protein
VLAARLGGTVGEMKGRMSYPEFLRWKAFYKHEPLGEQRLDLHVGSILKVLIKLLANQDVDAAKLMPKFWVDASEEVEPDILLAKARMIFGAMNATQPDH